MRISRKDYEKARADYKKNYELLNQTLYDLCKNHPDHRDMSDINAKLWIIGRTLATGIERLILSLGEESPLEELANHMFRNRKTIESIFERLSPITEPLDPEKLKVIVTEHGRFVELIAQKLRKNQSPRSFASKYMHFHCPAVPIYDSYASKELFRSYRWNDRYEIFERPAGADETYYYFILYFWQLYQNFKKSVKTEVRLLDCYLLWRADES